MNVKDLFLRELRFRWGSFLLGTAAVMAAAACVVGARGFLAAHDRETDRMLSELQARAEQRMAGMRDEARVFSKSLGFNILILPHRQDPAELYADHRSSHFFTLKQAQALARSRPATLNHLLPMLRHRFSWAPFEGDVVLVGIEGEIYIKAPHFQKPIEERLRTGHVHVGDAIRRRLNLAPGGVINIKGMSLTVDRLLPERGNIDDVTILMNLADLQRLLDHGDRISGILALSCTCAEGNLELIRRDVSRILPHARVIEFTVRARARKRAREAIGRQTRDQMADLKRGRSEMRDVIAKFSSALVALVTLGTVALLLVLGVTQARERREEVALLRAIGLHTHAILMLFLVKAALVGALGGVLGSGLCMLGARILHTPAFLATPGFVYIVVACAVLVALAAAALPAALAARTDPAVILNSE